MPINQRYLIVKNKDEKSITCFEYDKIKGVDISPKNNIKFTDAINVNKMVLINPSLIEKMIDKKISKRFDKLLKILAIIYDDNDDTGTGYREALNEITKFRLEIYTKYKMYMEEAKLTIALKKLTILENEVLERLNTLTSTYSQLKEGKSR
ncbi:MAG: hypothetical protein RSB99_03765 [Bacilli bacterium]